MRRDWYRRSVVGASGALHKRKPAFCTSAFAEPWPGTSATAFLRWRRSAEVGSDMLRKLTHNRLGSGRAFRGDVVRLMG